MSRAAATITLTDREQRELESLARRARIVLVAAQGLDNGTLWGMSAPTLRKASARRPQ